MSGITIYYQEYKELLTRKDMLKQCSVFLITLFLINVIGIAPIHCHSQTCYYPLYEDKDQKETPEQLIDKACQLKAEFPENMQDKFKVITTSNLIFEEYILDPQKRLALVRSRADTFSKKSPFYLSFIWIWSTNKDRRSVEINLELPTDGPFECLTELKRYSLIGGLVNYGKSLVPREGFFSDYAQVEVLVMDSLQSIIKTFKSCCVGGPNHSCEQCLSSIEISSAYNEFNNDVSHDARYKDTHGYIDKNSKAQEFRDDNFHITEIEPIFLQWEGETIRLSTLLIRYFTTRARGIFWETIITPPEICSTEDRMKLLSFINKSPSTIISEAKLDKVPEFTHKLMAAIRDDENLWLKVSTEDWMFHPIDLERHRFQLIGK